MNLNFMGACGEGNIERVNNLLKAGANPNQTNDYGNSPLIWTVYKSHFEIAKLLLKAGADPNFVDGWESTPIYWAVRRDQTEMVKLLLTAGANPKQVDMFGRTPLWYAMRNNNLEIVELLKSYENKISSLSLLCLRTIYKNQINTENIPDMILEWDFHK